MSYLQQKQRRKSAKKQKYNRVKRSKIFAKRIRVPITLPKNNTKESIQKEMTKSEVIDTLAIFFYNAIQKNERSKPRRNVGGTTTVLCTAPSIFNSHDVLHVTPPNIEEITNFINLIFEKRRLAAETGVVALVLLMRTSIKMNSSNWMRLILVSLLLANKEAEDVYNVWNVRFVGLIPNLPVYEINMLEMEFLQFLKYRLHVERPTYEKFYKQLLVLLPDKTEILEKTDTEESESLESESTPRLDDVEAVEDIDDVEEIHPNFDDSDEEFFVSIEKTQSFPSSVSGTCYPVRHIPFRPDRLSETISRVESIP